MVDNATREFDDPAAIRRELGELSRQLDEGQLSADEFDRLEDRLAGVT